MSPPKRRKTSRTRRLGGTAAQQRQADEVSAKFWYGDLGDTPENEQAVHQPTRQPVRQPDSDGDGSSATAAVTSVGVELCHEAAPIAVTPDPTSTVRSLGKPPLGGRETAAEHYFEAVYGRAVNMAGALAASANLLAPSHEEASL